MATSGTATFSLTNAEIVKESLLLLGAVDEFAEVGENQYNSCRKILNSMVKHWQIHANIWPKVDVTKTLTPGTASYTVGTGLDIDTARPMRLVSARRKDTSGREVPIEVFAREDYMGIPLKTTQGAPAGVYYDVQRASGTAYVWPTGDTVNNQVVLTFRRPLEDLTTAANDMDFPQEWHLAIIYNLAAKLAPKYPNQQSGFIKEEAERLLAELMQHDEEHVGFRLRHMRG